MNDFLEQIGQLDRRALIALMWQATERLEELENAGEWGLSPEQKMQIDQVRDAYERDGDPGEPWEKVRARIKTQAFSSAGQI